MRESSPTIRRPSTGLGMGVAAPYDEALPSINSRAPTVPHRRSRLSCRRSSLFNGAATAADGCAASDAAVPSVVTAAV